MILCERFSKNNEFLQIEDGVVDLFEGTVRSDNITIDYTVNSPNQPELLVEYIEGWRRKIWDHGFGPYLKGTSYFKKGDSFGNYEGSTQAIRRVLFRYGRITFNHVC